MTLLVADDDPGTRTILEGPSESWGYQVTLTRDGEEAWAALQRPSRPQMALLGWVVPCPDGAEICRRLRVRVRSGSATLREGLPKRAETRIRATGGAIYSAEARGGNRVAAAMEKDYREDE